jgi:hypothetical protein
MNRQLWTQHLRKNECPAWPCPTCTKGTVALISKSLVHNETVESENLRNHDAWEPDWVTYSFQARARCTRPECNEQFVIAGFGGLETVYDEHDELIVDFFVPLLVYPQPPMIEIPPKCPLGVVRELQSAFRVFRIDARACAGRIRVALECLMDHVGIPKKRKDKKGKYTVLSLHARIDAFAANEPTIGTQLMALKWLGNSGSHNAEVSESDVLDAFEIMEHALGELIGQRSDRIAKLAKQLTKKHS